MKFTVKYTLKSFVEAQRLFYTNSPYKWVIFLLGLFLVLLNGSSFLVKESLINSGGIVLGILILFYPYTFLYISAYFGFKKSETLHKPTEFEITDTAVKITNNVSTSETKWDAYIKYLSSNTTILLFIQSRLFIPIPRTSLSDDQWKELTSMLKEKIK